MTLERALLKQSRPIRVRMAKFARKRTGRDLTKERVRVFVIPSYTGDRLKAGALV
jgi:hypothetical protein